MAKDITLLGADYEDVPAVTLPQTGGGTATFYDLADVNYAASEEPGGNAIRTNGILFAQVDSTSTSTNFTVTIPGVTEYYDGLAIMLRNGVVTSAANFVINVNGLGGKASYSSMATGATPTRDTTVFNIAYTMLFVYSSTIVSGGAFIMYRGYDANTNTIGYQLRTNSSTMPMKQITYRYRILFTSLDGQGWVPSNTSTSTNATAKRDVNQAVIDPFGEIVYYGTTASVAAGSNPAATSLWQEYTLTLGYAFNRTGAALVLPFPKPIYIKCAPQTGGGAIIDADEPYVFTLPSTEDGKIYIYLGRTYSATAIEMTMNHPVYYFKDGAIREWTNAAASGGNVTSVNGQTGVVVLDAEDVGALPDDTVIPTKTSDLTNDSNFITAAGAPVQSVNGNTGAVTVQATLVSGTNIKTVNGNSLLGSGNLAISGLPSVTASDNGKVLTVVNGAWAAATLPVYDGTVV